MADRLLRSVAKVRASLLGVEVDDLLEAIALTDDAWLRRLVVVEGCLACSLIEVRL